jgi:pyridoxal 5'-phosphate synthase pdxS subunit
VEAQILQAIEVDYIDESEVLTMADEDNHIDKNEFNIPFVCGCRDLGEALRRVAEGAAMLRTKGEAGTGNIVEAVRHARMVQKQIRQVAAMSKEELYTYAKVRIYICNALFYCKRSVTNGLMNGGNDCVLQEIRAPYELVKQVAQEKRLPVVNFAAGGVATPADAALMMQLGT